MTPTEAENLRVVRDYLTAVGALTTGESLARFFAPDALQVELPNRLNPKGGQSDLPRMLERAAQVPALLVRQTYVVHAELAQGPLVAVEASWEGVLKVPLGTLAAGATMRADLALFFELREGKIFRQRNYDCFEPW